MKIALLFDKLREDTGGIYFERALRETEHEVRHFWLKDAHNIKPEFDLYLRIDHGDYKDDLPAHLKPSAFYVVDTHLKKPYRKIKEQAGHYDFIFCAQREGAERLKREIKVNAIWIPLGCDPQIHKRLNIEKRLDVGFVGTDGKKNPRVELIKLLARKYPNSFIGRADFRFLSNIYSSAKVSFNYSINNDINMRMFEAMACGSMLITNYINDNGFDELFTAGEHLVVYKNKNELLRLVDYYLGHDKEREEIARRGYELAISRHTYGDRVRQILSYVK